MSKKETKEINYVPAGTGLLIQPPKSDSGIILLNNSNMGLGAIVVKTGPDCTKVKVGDKVMFDAAIFPLEIDGETYWQLQSEHSVFGFVLGKGVVKQGSLPENSTPDPMGMYK